MALAGRYNERKGTFALCRLPNRAHCGTASGKATQSRGAFFVMENEMRKWQWPGTYTVKNQTTIMRIEVLRGPIFIVQLWGLHLVWNPFNTDS